MVSSPVTPLKRGALAAAVLLALSACPLTALAQEEAPEDAPATEAPAEETPAPEAPAGQAPAEEAPAEEPAEQNQQTPTESDATAPAQPGAVRSTHGAWSIVCDNEAGAPDEQCALMQNVIAEEKVTFVGHPERLALVGGKRQGEQF